MARTCVARAMASSRGVTSPGRAGLGLGVARSGAVVATTCPSAVIAEVAAEGAAAAVVRVGVRVRNGTTTRGLRVGVRTPRVDLVIALVGCILSISTPEAARGVGKV